MVGQFIQGLGQWWRNVWEGLDANDEILTLCGLAAFGYDVEGTSELDPDDVSKAMDLVDRALYVWIFGVALVTIGAWFY